MKKSSVNWNVKQFSKMVDKGTISFDYPIQREGSQWDDIQKSLLIHSLAEDFPVPPLYSITEPIDLEEGKKPQNLYYILDGKQRLTNIKNFIDNQFVLHEDTPSAEIDGVKYELSEKIFDELEEEVQDAILSFSLQIYKMDEITDEQIEDLFYRLNNGTPLSKQQKSKAKMGTEWAKKIQSIVSHEVMQEKASFTALQIKKADHETAILQTMMLIDDNHELKSISSNDVFNYALTFKGDNSKDALVEKVVKAMDYLNQAFDEKEPTLMKKVHFPMTLITAMNSLENGVSSEVFADWKEEFKKSLKAKKDTGYIPTDYKRFGGAGSVKKDKVEGRIKAMQNHMGEFLNRFYSQHEEKNVNEKKEEIIVQ